MSVLVPKSILKPLFLFPPPPPGILPDKRMELEKHNLNVGEGSRAIGKSPGSRPQIAKESSVDRSPYFDKVRLLGRRSSKGRGEGDTTVAHHLRPALRLWIHRDCGRQGAILVERRALRLPPPCLFSFTVMSL